MSTFSAPVSGVDVVICSTGVALISVGARQTRESLFATTHQCEKSLSNTYTSDRHLWVCLVCKRYYDYH